MVTRVRRVVLGVDLGKRQTPATIIAVQTQIAAPFWDPVRLRWNQSPGQTSVIRWVEAVPLETSYHGVARRIWEIAEHSGASQVWMDCTGVGVAVEEMVQQRKPPGLKCMLKPFTITSGQTVSQTSVPRSELMTRLAVEWQEGRVKVAKGLSRWPELRKELLALDGQGRKKNGRDDLALGLALAVWGLTGMGAWPLGLIHSWKSVTASQWGHECLAQATELYMKSDSCSKRAAWLPCPPLAAIFQHSSASGA